MEDDAMVSIAASESVGDLARRHPAWIRVFERHGIDYCCGGKQPLSDVCRAQGVDLTALTNELEHSEGSPRHHEDLDWSTRPLRALVRHILEKHHAYLRCELPRLGALLEKVVEKHSSQNAALRELASVFSALESELTLHMRKEETVLFPWVCEMEETRTVDRAPCVTVRKPIHVMEHEHRFAGDSLARIRWLADDFVPPVSACPTMRALYEGLEELELDLHRHIHEENNVLFPRAIELEAQLAR
jgi:regulator of cell morphogenesis and NO signaling